MGPPMWPWRCGLMARPVSGVEWSGVIPFKYKYFIAVHISCFFMLASSA